jgi:hypothetical protein
VDADADAVYIPPRTFLASSRAPSLLLATEHKINREELLVQTLDAKEACADARPSENSSSTGSLLRRDMRARIARNRFAQSPKYA